ncbi:ABC transporter permease [Cellulomonas sp. P24]|uniref:ABC transporter permease n=1 Tax=Cellulomonas sp. P24 TaxID=2885206 RepID=UPI00216B6756|nr:ABC transporter permease subunit [Cellulomonas sp. P24]MCR6492493.1 ABC transporter permease subunit [Cellulomonas sp. P24]
MTTSTTAADAVTRDRWRAVARPLLVMGFWLGVWQLATVAVHQDLLLVSPGAVLVRLTQLVVTAGFWGTVWYSFARIVAGFLLAAVAGVLGAAVASASRVVDALATPLIAAIRSTPVVSFIILVLMWADSSRLAIIISFTMVVPVVYTNVLDGIRHRDRALLEVSTVFRVPLLRRLAAIDIPAVLPFFIAACKIGVGLAWKSGIAAEVIGLPRGSIGERLYQAKIFLSTADLFAWTVVIIALSFAFERLVLVVLARTQLRLAHGRAT